MCDEDTRPGVVVAGRQSAALDTTVNSSARHSQPTRGLGDRAPIPSNIVTWELHVAAPGTPQARHLWRLTLVGLRDTPPARSGGESSPSSATVALASDRASRGAGRGRARCWCSAKQVLR